VFYQRTSCCILFHVNYPGWEVENLFAHVNFSLHFAMVLLTLIGIQFVLGKKAAFPYGMVMGLSPVFVGMVVLAQDVIQTPLVIRLLEGTTRFSWLEKFRRRLIVDEERLKNSRLMGWLRRMQHLGIVVVVSTPFAGGIWTGCILSHAFGLNRLNAFLLIALGSTFGVIIFVLSAIGLMHLVS
jgi:uncharacterized membrane protein